jgi:hypothetical protein
MLGLFCPTTAIILPQLPPLASGNDGNMAPATEHSTLALCHIGTRALAKIQEILTHRLAPDLNAKAPGRKVWTKTP